MAATTDGKTFAQEFTDAYKNFCQDDPLHIDHTHTETTGTFQFKGAGYVIELFYQKPITKGKSSIRKVGEILSPHNENRQFQYMPGWQNKSSEAVFDALHDFLHRGLDYFIIGWDEPIEVPEN